MKHRLVGAAGTTALISVVAVVAFLVAAFMLLPKGFSGDTSVIGQGTNVIVLAHNKDSVQSLNLMDLLNKVRGDYGDRVKFVVADANTPRGQAFVDSQNVELGTLLLFKPDGTRVSVVRNVTDEATLRSALGVFN